MSFLSKSTMSEHWKDLSFNEHFPTKPWLAIFPCTFFLFQIEPSGMLGITFYGPDVLPVNERTASKHWGKLDALNPTSGLTSTSHPPWNSWQRWQYDSVNHEFIQCIIAVVGRLHERRIILNHAGNYQTNVLDHKQCLVTSSAMKKARRPNTERQQGWGVNSWRQLADHPVLPLCQLCDDSSTQSHHH